MFRNVSVIPMDSERVLDAQTVVVRGERIESVGAASGAQIPAGARVIDGTGRYLVPGLAEMHAHVPTDEDQRYVEEVLFLYVANGVTTARGMLGAPEHITLRERLAKHEVLGPRLYTSGPSLNDQSVGSPDEAARIVREQARAGYDFVKVHPGPTRAEYDAAVQAGAASGIELAGHVPADVGVQRAIEAKQATIDHLDGYVEALVPAARRAQGGFFGINLARDADRSRIPALVVGDRGGRRLERADANLDRALARALAHRRRAARASRDGVRVSPQTRTGWANAKRQIMSGPGYDGERARARHAAPRDRQGAARRRRRFAARLRRATGLQRAGVLAAPRAHGHRRVRPHAVRGAANGHGESRGVLRRRRRVRHDSRGSRGRSGARRRAIRSTDVAALARPEGVMVRGRWLDRAELDRGLAEIAARYRR